MADFTLAGQVALVTGGSRGLGAGIAMELAAAGADLAITARRVPALEKTRREVERLGRRALPLPMEATDLSSIRATVNRVEHELGPISILVNNVGTNIPRPATEVKPEEWDTMLDTNLRGLFFCSQLAAEYMIPRRRGKIVNIASTAGMVASLERAPYGASKAGVIMLTRHLAYEWAKHNITVNAVAPTFVETELAARTLSNPDMREFFLARIPLNRFGKVEDVAAAVLYLASPAADFVTGVVLPVDGGMQVA